MSAVRLSFWLSWKEKGGKGGRCACWPTCGEGCGGTRPGWTTGEQPPGGASYLVLIWLVSILVKVI